MGVDSAEKTGTRRVVGSNSVASGLLLLLLLGASHNDIYIDAMSTSTKGDVFIRKTSGFSLGILE